MRVRYTFIAVLSAIAIVTGCMSTPVTVMVKDSGDETVKTKSGKNFSIRLKSQLSTGFSWKIAEMPETVTLVKENVIAEPTDITGGYELQEFIFRTSKTGGVVIFKYGEHWKKKPEYVNTSKITIQIE